MPRSYSMTPTTNKLFHEKFHVAVWASFFLYVDSIDRKPSIPVSYRICISSNLVLYPHLCLAIRSTISTSSPRNDPHLSSVGSACGTFHSCHLLLVNHTRFHDKVKSSYREDFHTEMGQVGHCRDSMAQRHQSFESCELWQDTWNWRGRHKSGNGQRFCKKWCF